MSELRIRPKWQQGMSAAALTALDYAARRQQLDQFDAAFKARTGIDRRTADRGDDRRTVIVVSQS